MGKQIDQTNHDAQIKEMSLIINALQASNELLDFRLNEVLKTNKDLQEKLDEANKKIEEYELPKQDSKPEKQNK